MSFCTYCKELLDFHPTVLWYECVRCNLMQSSRDSLLSLSRDVGAFDVYVWAHIGNNGSFFHEPYRLHEDSDIVVCCIEIVGPGIYYYIIDPPKFPSSIKEFNIICDKMVRMMSFL